MIRSWAGFGLIDLFTDIQEQVDKSNGKEDTFEAFNNETKVINHHENTKIEDNLFYKSFNHFPLFTGVKVNNNNYSNEAFSDNDEEMAFSKNNDIEDNTRENQHHEKPIHQQVWDFWIV